MNLRLKKHPKKTTDAAPWWQLTAGTHIMLIGLLGVELTAAIFVCLFVCLFLIPLTRKQLLRLIFILFSDARRLWNMKEFGRS